MSDFRIKNGVLTQYTGVGGAVVVPEGVTEIGERAFSGCSSLTSIKLPEGVTEIGERAFEDCSGLASITLPEGLHTIGTHVFAECVRLRSIVLPSTVSRIAKEAFEASGVLSLILTGESAADAIDVYEDTHVEELDDGELWVWFDRFTYICSVTLRDPAREAALYTSSVHREREAVDHVSEITFPEQVIAVDTEALLAAVDECRITQIRVENDALLARLRQTVPELEAHLIVGNMERIPVSMIIFPKPAIAVDTEMLLATADERTIRWIRVENDALLARLRQTVPELREQLLAGETEQFDEQLLRRASELKKQLLAGNAEHGSLNTITFPEQVTAVDTELLLAMVDEGMIGQIHVENDTLLVQLLQAAPELREQLLAGNMERILNSPEVLAVPELQQAPIFDRLMEYARVHDMMPSIALLLEAHHAVSAGTDEEDIELDLDPGLEPSPDGEAWDRFVIRDGILLECHNHREDIVTVPDSVTVIADQAFWVYMPRSIILPDTIRRIGKSMFCIRDIDHGDYNSTLLLDVGTARRSRGAGHRIEEHFYYYSSCAHDTSQGVWMDWGDGDPGYVIPDPLETAVYGRDDRFRTPFGTRQGWAVELLPICTAQLRERDRVREVELWQMLRCVVFLAGEERYAQLTLPPQLIRLDVPALQDGLKSVRVERFTVYGEEALEQLLREAPEYRLRLAEDNAERILTSSRLIELPMLTEGPLFVRLTQYADSHGMKDAADRLRLLRRERGSGHSR